MHDPLLLELQLRHEALGIPQRQIAKQTPIPFVRLPHHHELPLPPGRFRRRLRPDLQPLLPRHPAHAADQRRLRLRQAIVPLHRPLEPPLPLHRLAAIALALLQIPVRRRVPELRIEPIHYPGEVIRPPAQRLLQPRHQTRLPEAGVLPHLYLLSVRRRDSRDLVSARHPPFHEVHLSIELHVPRMKHIIPVPALLRIRHVENPLMKEVMDAQDGRDSPVSLVFAEHALQAHRHQRRMPVVTVDHLRRPLHRRQRLQHRAAEEPVARRIVALAVQPPAIEERGRIHQASRHTRNRAARIQVEGDTLASHPGGDPPPQQLHRRLLGIDPGVLRQHHPHVVPQRRQRLRQRPRHIRKTACHHERPHLSRAQQYLHLAPPLALRKRADHKPTRCQPAPAAWQANASSLRAPPPRYNPPITATYENLSSCVFSTTSDSASAVPSCDHAIPPPP